MTRSMADIPVSDRIGSRATRRAWVVALYAGYALFGAGLLAGDTAHGALRLFAGIVAIGAIATTVAALGVLLRRTTINAPQITSAALDERQRARRDRATWIASLANSIIFALFAAYATLALTFAPAAAPPALLSYLLWAAALFATTLPTAIMAWTEPDPLPAD